MYGIHLSRSWISNISVLTISTAQLQVREHCGICDHPSGDMGMHTVGQLARLAQRRNGWHHLEHNRGLAVYDSVDRFHCRNGFNGS